MHMLKNAESKAELKGLGRFSAHWAHPGEQSPQNAGQDLQSSQGGQAVPKLSLPHWDDPNWKRIDCSKTRRRGCTEEQKKNYYGNKFPKKKKKKKANNSVGCIKKKVIYQFILSGSFTSILFNIAQASTLIIRYELINDALKQVCFIS